MSAVPFSEHDRLRHQLAAETTLAELDLYEDVAELHDTAVGAERDRFAAWYRTLVGVHPDRRQDLRAVVKRIEADGNRLVEDVVREFGQTSNPSSAA
jgi:hypothetical protein